MPGSSGSASGGHRFQRRREQGQIVDHPLNRRVIALAPEDLRPIPTVILASGGPDKVPAIRAALALGIVDTIVTDERSAAAVLGLPGA